jgi:hypothetical protein
MCGHAPAAREQVAYGIPMWKTNGWVAFLSPTTRDVTDPRRRNHQTRDPDPRGSGRVDQQCNDSSTGKEDFEQ